MNTFFYEIERKFAREKRGSAIDVDIFANRATSKPPILSLVTLITLAPLAEDELEQLEELLFKFRRTKQTFLTSPGTIQATVRAFLNNNRTDNLMRMIDDRLNFGLFIDDYSHVLLLNHFLVNENWRDAAKVGVHMMLQEEMDIPIAKEMALLGVYKVKNEL